MFCFVLGCLVADSRSIGPGQLPSLPPPFRYHSLHDLESLWWIALYYTICKDVIDHSESNRETRVRKQLELGKKLFWRGMSRQTAFRDTGMLLWQLQCLHPSLHHVAQSLEQARLVLKQALLTSETDLHSIPLDVTDQVYRDVSRHLDAIAHLPSLDGLYTRDFSDS